jgi:hypothetical protein
MGDMINTSRARSRRTRAGVVAAMVLGPALVLASCSSTAGTATGTATPSVAPGSAPAGAAGSTAPPGSAVAAGIPDRFKGATSETYAKDSSWLCRPGIAEDHCTKDPLDSTILNADGTTQVVPRKLAADAGVDCFYVYPTVNLTPGGGNKMTLDNPGIEIAVLDQQAARFADVCTMYAPLYRQMNLSAYASPEPERKKADALAYGDVHEAFAYYMAHFNKGRPVVLIGHSQGSGHLAHLLQDEFDHDDAMKAKLVSAMLIGGFVQVPVGKDVGGTFQTIPLCRSTTQTGCVVTYNSFGAVPPPDASAGFGRTTPEGLTGGCVNPGAPRGGSATLQPFVGPNTVKGAVAPIATPFVQLPDAMAAECVSKDGRTYLEIAAATRAGDTRDVTKAVTNTPGWGLHLTEFNLTLGNLLDLLRHQIAAR